MEFRVTFYTDAQGNKPLLAFLDGLKQEQPALEKLVAAGLGKLRDREYHHRPLTELVDPEHAIYELRVGGANIARVFFFFAPGRQIVATNGYVKKGRKLDRSALQRAQTAKRDWERCHAQAAP